MWRAVIRWSVAVSAASWAAVFVAYARQAWSPWIDTTDEDGGEGDVVTLFEG